MSTLVEQVAARLGLGSRSSATAEEVLVALDDALAPRGRRRVPVALLDEGPVVAVDSAVWEDVQKRAADAVAARREQLVAPARAQLDAAVRQGRLSPFEARGLRALLADQDADPASAAELVTGHVAGLSEERFPVTEIGHAISPDPELGVADPPTPGFLTGGPGR